MQLRMNIKMKFGPNITQFDKRKKYFKQNGPKNDDNWRRNKEVETYCILCKTFLEQSLQISNRVRGCHTLTILYSFHLQKMTKISCSGMRNEILSSRHQQ